MCVTHGTIPVRWTPSGIWQVEVMTDGDRQIQWSRESIRKGSLMRRRGSVVDMEVVDNFFGVHFLPVVVVLVVLEKAEKMSFGKGQGGRLLECH